MNLDLHVYNFHTHATLPQTSQSSNVKSPASRVLANSSTFCRSWNDGICCCPLVSAATATAVKNVKESTPVSTVPFRPQSLIVSTRGQLPRHGVNASGISVVARSSQPTFQKNLHVAHNVDIPCSVQTSNVVFLVSVYNVVTSTQDFSDKPPETSAQTSCPNLSSFIDCLQHTLVTPYTVTPIDAEKLWRELYFHPDQTQVDYVISGLSNGFHLGFNPLAVS